MKASLQEGRETRREREREGGGSNEKQINQIKSPDPAGSVTFLPFSVWIGVLRDSEGGAEANQCDKENQRRQRDCHLLKPCQGFPSAGNPSTQDARSSGWVRRDIQERRGNAPKIVPARPMKKTLISRNQNRSERQMPSGQQFIVLCVWIDAPKMHHL